MKKFLLVFIGLLLFPLASQAAESQSAPNYKEGTHYDVISQTATRTPEVTEFFSFYCGHCYAFEPFMAELKTSLADNVAFNKNHVDFLGGAMGAQLSNAYAAAKILQVEDKFAALVFARLQTQRKAINGEQDILAIFEQAGISQQEAQAARQSFTVVGLASQMKRKTETSKIRGVPTVIVNGKYKVNRASLKSAQEFIDLVNYLSQKQD